jgi:TP901 family phage tail tape measure protein
VQVNFDAEIKLDIGPFIASIKTAQSEVQNLASQIDELNKKSLSIKGSAGADGGSSARKQAAAAEVAKQREVEKAQQVAHRNEMQAIKTADREKELAHKEQMRRIQAEDKARVKDHDNASKIHDTEIAMREKEGKVFSTQLRAQMQEQQKADNSKLAAAQQAERNLSRERYALYDVAAAYTAIAAAAGSVIRVLAGTAIDFERSFVNVERTTEFVSAKIGAAAESAKRDLKSLASEIPVTFGQITEIATIGNQLGIAQGSLTSFTETVSKFSATTGVSVESTAMSFGRVGELLDVAAQDYEKMGSSIAFAGVNAVATEEQILSVTREIATTAKMAKFSTADVIGLSTALSSLGIAPEAARGSIIRTFAGINKVISEGGNGLQQYASIANMSAEEFASSWQTNGEVAFRAFLGGLQNLSDQGKNLDSVLRGIGMKNVRDIQTIQKLGDNYDVYVSSLKDANQGYEEGTFLANAYSKIQDTVAAKLQVMSNNFANLFDELGQAGVGDAFKLILDVVNDLLVRLTQFARSPIGKFFGYIVTIGSAVVALFASINAISALAKASLRAFATAQTALIGSSAGASAAIGGMNAELAATATLGNTASLGLKKSEIAARAFGTAMKAIKVLAIITAIIFAVERMAYSFSSAKDKAEGLLGGFSGLQDALRADLDEYNTSLTEFGGDTTKAKEAAGVIVELTTEYENNNAKANKAIEGQNLLNEMFGTGQEQAGLLSEEMETLNFVIGENTRAWLINAFANSEAFQKMSQNKDAMRAIIDSGFDLNTALQEAANGTLDQYLGRVSEKAVESASGYEKGVFWLHNLGATVSEGTKKLGPFGDALSMIAGLFGWLIGLIPRAVNELTRFFGFDAFPVTNGIADVGDAIQGVYDQSLILGPAMDGLGKDVDGADGEFEGFNDTLGGTARQLRTVIDYANDLRSVLDRAFELRFGRQQALDDVASGWIAMAESADAAKKKIQQATDAIAKANAEIAELTADKSVLQYQLTVAERYGDEARAAQIRAKIAKIDADIAGQNSKIASSREDISSASGTSQKSEIELRATLLDQVRRYKDLIEMYAKTGMKKKGLEKQTKKMKQEFLEQGLALGLSRKQLKPYLAMFRDMGKAIKETPRKVDIEVNANLSPAEQAVREFIAKTNNQSATVTIRTNNIVTNTTTGPTKPKTPSSANLPPINDPTPPSSKKGAIDNPYVAAASTTPGTKTLSVPLESYVRMPKGLYMHGITLGSDNKVALRYGLEKNNINGKPFPIIGSLIKVGLDYAGKLPLLTRFATGGFVSGMGSSTSDSVPALLSNGEFVVKANAVKSYGVDFLNALNQQKLGSFSGGQTLGQSQTGSTVAQLSPEDRALLRAVIDRPINLYTDNAKIASSANAGNVVLAQRGTR